MKGRERKREGERQGGTKTLGILTREISCRDLVTQELQDGENKSAAPG